MGSQTASTRKKIVLINNQGIGQHGGGPTIMRQLSARLSVRNDITVISFDPPCDTAHDVRQIMLPPAKVRHWRLAPYYRARHYQHALRNVDIGNPDFLIAMDCHLALAFPALPAQRNAYISLSCIPRQEWFSARRPYIATFIQYAYLERTLIQKADITVVASESQRREISRFELLANFEPLVLPPIFAGSDALRDEAPKKAAVVFMALSRLASVKRIDRILAIADRLRDHDCHFLIVGDGPHAASLKQKTEDMGLVSKVTFTGATDTPEVFLRQSDILLHPSAYESFGIAVFEAMRYGLVPVISQGSGSTIGIASDIADNTNGLLVDFDDLDAVARKLERLLIDAEHRQHLKDNARKNAKRMLTHDYVGAFANALDLDVA